MPESAPILPGSTLLAGESARVKSVADRLVDAVAAKVAAIPDVGLVLLPGYDAQEDDTGRVALTAAEGRAVVAIDTGAEVALDADGAENSVGSRQLHQFQRYKMVVVLTVTLPKREAQVDAPNTPWRLRDLRDELKIAILGTYGTAGTWITEADPTGLAEETVPLGTCDLSREEGSVCFSHAFEVKFRHVRGDPRRVV